MSGKFKGKEKLVALSRLQIDCDRCGAVSRFFGRLVFQINVVFNSPQERKPILTPDGVRMLAEIRPILAYQEGKNFVCFGGFRTFFLAQMILKSGEKIPVRVFPRKMKNIEEFAYADFFLGQTFSQLQKNSALGEIWNNTPPHLIKRWTPKLSSKVGFSKCMNMNKKTVFAPNLRFKINKQQTPTKSIEDPETSRMNVNE